MGDELSEFFAKKKKKGDRSRKLRVDDVGDVLERKSKQQEEHDQADEEEERRAQTDQAFFEKQAEDSEWIDPNADNGDVEDGIGIKYMSLSDQPEETYIEDKTVTHEPPKTWAVDSTESKKLVEEVVLPEKAMPYRPRHLQPIKKVNIPNINDQESFPTFEAAEQIEKMRSDDKKKKNDDFTVVTSDRSEQSSYASRLNANRTSYARPMQHSTQSQAPQLSQKPKDSLPARNPNAYIPPALRRQLEANK